MIRSCRRWVRARLQRTIFVAFGVTILVSAAVFGAISMLGAPSRMRWTEELRRVEGFVGRQFALVWSDPIRREFLAREYADGLDVALQLRDPEGRLLEEVGGPCEGHRFRVDVRDLPDAPRLGRIEVCRDHPDGPPPFSHLLALLGAAAVLWAASGLLARRIARPLRQVGHVARDIGDGKLSSRVALRGHRQVPGELGQLAEAVNDMAERIEKQLSDQRELLAAVSHEIRTPLGHLRVLIDIAKDRGVDPSLMAEVEREVLEADELVDQLLATSRLEFESIDRRTLDAATVAIDALERKGLSPDLVEVEVDDLRFNADPTLVARALANLVDNAIRHGGGVEKLRVEGGLVDIRFVVEDSGPGFDGVDRQRVFEPFYRGERQAGASGASLGLGLSLVQRIARAHGGRAFVEDRPGGGARVGFSVQRNLGRG